MPYHELFFLWAGGAVAWLYLVHFAVRKEDKAFNFWVALLLSMAWPITIPLSEIMRWGKPDAR